jgi:hypothetical protein
VLNEEGKRNLLEQINKLWITPEIKRREALGANSQFSITRCLIRLPKDRPPIVEFNDEIKWLALVKKAPGTTFQKGQRVLVHEIETVTDVNPPEVDGQRVAFVYLFSNDSGRTYDVAFDFTQNVPEGIIHDKAKAGLGSTGKAIAESLQALLVERVIRIQNGTQTLLRNNGFWAIPALLPYPLSKITTQLQEGDIQGAHQTLLNRCTPEFIKQLSSKWWTVKEFASRKPLIEEALQCHMEHKYISSIHTLLPHVEGIITDWIYTRMSPSEIPWKQESKTKKLHSLILDTAPSTYTYTRIVDSAIEFIVDGPVLETFKKWMQQIETTFPSRNVVEHGKFEPALFTEENSVKLFLLLDTIYYILSSSTYATKP